MKGYDNLYKIITPKVKSQLSQPETITEITMKKYIEHTEIKEIIKGYGYCSTINTNRQ